MSILQVPSSMLACMHTSDRGHLSQVSSLSNAFKQLAWPDSLLENYSVGYSTIFFSACAVRMGVYSIFSLTCMPTCRTCSPIWRESGNLNATHSVKHKRRHVTSSTVYISKVLSHLCSSHFFWTTL